MFLQPGSEDSTIVRMRVQAMNLDPLTARLRVSRMLSCVELRPTMLPPSAILFIRRLPDPLPGAVHLEAHDFQPPAAWREALTRRINQLAAAAVYPARGEAANDSEAVIFSQQSELLACLAHDWLHSDLTARWWWQSFLRNSNVSQLIRQLWRESPEYVPAALQYLSQRASAATFVASLDDEYVHDLVRSITRCFALRLLLVAVDKQLPTIRTSATIDERSKASISAQQPWREHVPEAQSRELSPEQQRFLGIALTIRRAPSHVISYDFTRAVERWQTEIVRLTQTGRPIARQRELAVPGSKDDGWQPPKPVGKTAAASPDEGQPIVARQTERAADRGDDHNVRPQPRAGLPHKESAVIDQAGGRAPELSAAERIHLPLPPVRQETVEPPIDISDWQSGPSEVNQLFEETTAVDLAEFETSSIEIGTRLGGLFYLINLSQYLNLYGDFTTPSTLGIDLNIWDFVTLVAQEFVGKAYANDSIWSFLAKLGGREIGKAAGENFQFEDEWRLPAEWLSSFSNDQACRWSAGRGRLRLLHHDGFAILDLPLTGDPREQLQRELEPYGNSVQSISRGRLPKIARRQSNISAPVIRRWLSLLMPYVYARLRIAFGLESNKTIAAMLCRHDATVRATDTHINVFFGLADLALEIRCAGLDRDPGWVPAAGRFIAFHFE